MLRGSCICIRSSTRPIRIRDSEIKQQRSVRTTLQGESEKQGHSKIRHTPMATAVHQQKQVHTHGGIGTLTSQFGILFDDTGFGMIVLE